MRSPALDRLPAPPPNKIGWPWTQNSELLPDLMPNGRPWPQISIVTPNYNYGKFLAETIRSVLLQGYPNLEYLVIDGGSSDESLAVIAEYQPWLSYSCSERDRGQSHAINKGLTRATGAILAWLNSDDLYLPNALANVAMAFAQHPDVALIYGKCRTLTGDRVLGDDMWRFSPFVLPQMLVENQIPQASAFWTATSFQQAGPLREDLHFVMDYDLFLKIACTAKIAFVPEHWSAFRSHDAQKSHDDNLLKVVAERRAVYRRLWQAPYFPKARLKQAWRQAMALQFRTSGSVWLQRGHWVKAIGHYLRSLVYHPGKLGDLRAVSGWFHRIVGNGDAKGGPQ